MSTTDFYNIEDRQIEVLQSLADYLLDLYRDNKNVLRSHYPAKEVTYLHRALLNFKLFVTYCSYFFVTPRLDPPEECHRDKVMADTLIFLANEYFPDEKIIVWAATYHNMWNHHQILHINGYRWYGDYPIMGNYLHEELGDEVYSIAPITYEGWSEWVWGIYYTKIEPAVEGSLSWYLHELGGKYYFLDMKSIRPTNWLHKKLLARPLQSKWFMQASWPEIFDAFIYMEKTRGCKHVERPQ